MKDTNAAVIICFQLCVCVVVVIAIMQQCAIEDIKHSGSGKTLYTMSSNKK